MCREYAIKGAQISCKTLIGTIVDENEMRNDLEAVLAGIAESENNLGLTDLLSRKKSQNDRNTAAFYSEIIISLLLLYISGSQCGGNLLAMVSQAQGFL